jgi:hypothetical protein
LFGWQFGGQSGEIDKIGEQDRRLGDAVGDDGLALP